VPREPATAPSDQAPEVASQAGKPSGPRGLPLLGCLLAFRKNPLAFLERSAAEHGDLSYFRLGNQDVFLLNHPELIREVLVRRQSNFVKSRGLRRARVLLGDGLLTSEGEVHLRHRRLVQPAFHQDRLRGYAAVMVDFAERSRERWRQGDELEIFREMIRLTLGVVSKTLFSADVETDPRKIGKALTNVFEMLSVLMMPFSEIVEKLPLPSVRRFHRARKLLDDTIYGLIRERRESGEDRGDLLSMLLLAQDEEEGGGLSDREVREEALTLFLAGHETTANALSWGWYLLSQNPDCEARLHEEVDRVLGGRRATFDDLPRLPYAEMVFSEVIRLYPPAWAIGRTAMERFELGGYEVPAGSTCIASSYVTQRDPRFFPDPERFVPERWQPERRAELPKFAYFPFGGGARTCIGERFAKMEGMLVLATLAQRWRLRLAPGQEVEPVPLINTLRAKGGLRMIVEPR
jgi:cytochrome P450